MTADVQHLDRDNLLHEYGLDTQRLFPWDVLNAPFESSWAVARPHSSSTLHSHHEHEIFIAVRGNAVIEYDGDPMPFEAGDVCFFRPGHEHQVINDTDEAFVFYSVWWDAEMSERFLARDAREAHDRAEAHV
jgi:mannose-6-phosphate isomerase-like protein (cupin superfamily)